MADRKFRVIITDSEYETYEPEKAALSGVNVDLIKLPFSTATVMPTEDEVIKGCRGADAVITQYAKLTRRVIDSLNNTKIIVRYGIGVDNIDIEAATDNGIYVANVIYNIFDVADHTISLAFSALRKIALADDSVKSGVWDWNKFKPIPRLKGKTYGIIGFGRVGKEIAHRMKGFGVKLISYDPYLPDEVFKKHEVKKVDLETLFQESDLLSIHVGLTKETLHMINEETLQKMKKTAILVNASRGPVVDEKALYKALKEKWITGAGIDVLEKEPPEKDNPLFSLENILITPHMAWYSEGTIEEVQRKAAEEVARVLSGKLPVSLVNKEVLEKK